MTQKRVGVIGWPIEHSLSPAMHNAAFEALGMQDEWHYDKSAIPPEILKKSLREFMMHGYVGLNVTVPFKQEVVALFRSDPIVQAVGAANTLVFPRNEATNTDVFGFIDDLQAHGIPLQGQTVILLGAGGAARAALYGLTQVGAQVLVINRTVERAQAMMDAMRLPTAQVVTAHEALESGATLLVNSTSVGMHPHIDQSPWDSSLPLPPHVTVYDMIYRPAVTTLMRQAEAQQLRAINGLGMLVRQGAASFQIWTGRKAPLEVMFDAVEAQLYNRKG